MAVSDRLKKRLGEILDTRTRKITPDDYADIARIIALLMHNKDGLSEDLADTYLANEEYPGEYGHLSARRLLSHLPLKRMVKPSTVRPDMYQLTDDARAWFSMYVFELGVVSWKKVLDGAARGLAALLEVHERYVPEVTLEARTNCPSDEAIAAAVALVRKTQRKLGAKDERLLALIERYDAAVVEAEPDPGDRRGIPGLPGSADRHMWPYERMVEAYFRQEEDAFREAGARQLYNNDGVTAQWGTPRLSLFPHAALNKLIAEGRVRMITNPLSNKYYAGHFYMLSAPAPAADE